MTVLYRSFNPSRATDISTKGHPETLRIEAGSELAQKLVGTVPINEFLTLAFPQQRHDGILSRAYEDASAQAKEDVLALLKEVPTGDGVEKLMYESLIKAMTAICEALWPGQSSLYVKDSSSESSEDGGSPDLTFYSDNQDNRTDAWECGLGFVEVKPTDAQDPLYVDEQDCSKPLRIHLKQIDVWNQIQDYATRAYHRRSRCFQVAIGIFGNYARFFRWDHSLGMVSRAFDYKKEPEFLWQFIAAFGSPAHHGHGLDPTVGDYVEVKRLAVPDLKEKYVNARKNRLLSSKVSGLSDADLLRQSSVITIPSRSRDIQEKYITIGPPLFASKAILGRGTRAWLAVPVPGTVDNPERSNEDHFVIIKDSWRELSRAKEGDIYKAIYGDADKVFGVARIRCDLDLYDPAVSSDGENTMHRTIAEWISQQYGRHFSRRIHHRSVLDSVGIDLSRFESTRELMEAIRDGVKGHRNMSNNKVLHRDISAKNVMISAYPEKESMAKGFLIDMDYATVTGDGECEDDLREITGTTAFLSMARVQGTMNSQMAPHAIWNDLESFFWVTVYIVVRHTDTEKTMPAGRIVQIFDSGDVDKRMRYVRRDIAATKVKGHIPLARCLQALAKLVASHYALEDLDPDVRADVAERHAGKYFLLKEHQVFIDTVQKELDSEDWPRPANDFKARSFAMGLAPARTAREETIKTLKESIESTRESKRKREAEAEEEETAPKRARQETEASQGAEVLPHAGSIFDILI
ncbi:hypothetical protein OE88DRAFT_1656333 [Heliocybe sulcata]|uniref:Fungal-type protein kinase domain-containing protein n=1 Tax=Heliocybe sulcata TaxID=5364 RepID=A0A5C3N653_9AGAM|nr:hypothetical protein OE88DRAFT_1656333 [Heliocybe sulcata]